MLPPRPRRRSHRKSGPSKHGYRGAGTREMRVADPGLRVLRVAPGVRPSGSDTGAAHSPPPAFPAEASARGAAKRRAGTAFSRWNSSHRLGARQYRSDPGSERVDAAHPRSTRKAEPTGYGVRPGGSDTECNACTPPLTNPQKNRKKTYPRPLAANTYSSHLASVSGGQLENVSNWGWGQRARSAHTRA